ncbi:MAG: thioesterase family protein [Actinomycetota bacterium]
MIEPGLTETARYMVTEDMTASDLGSGEVSLLGTPAVLALVERSAVAAVAAVLEPGTTTVGARVELDHVAPSLVGATVSVTTRLVAVDERRLTFSFEVSDAGGIVATGTHLRVVVDRDRFLERAEARAPSP